MLICKEGDSLKKYIKNHLGTKLIVCIEELGQFLAGSSIIQEHYPQVIGFILHFPLSGC